MVADTLFMSEEVIKSNDDDGGEGANGDEDTGVVTEAGAKGVGERTRERTREVVVFTGEEGSVIDLDTTGPVTGLGEAT